MKNTTVWGWIAFVITFAYTSVGLSVQILINYQNKSVSGLSLLMMTLSFSAFGSWFIYGALKKDKYIIMSNVLGIICTGIILVQFYIYR